MIRLHNDYNRGACEKILEKLAQINGESYDGYGEDTWCEKAAKLIREKCKAPEAAIHFLPGATQANFIVHAAALSPIQSVICPDSGHVYAHEAGSIENTGLIEVPMGTTLREVIFGIGGGIKDGKKFKAVQTGGPSGGCLTEKHLDLPIDYDNLLAAGSMMGSGGMIVMDEDDCMVAMAKFYLDFTVEESCGKCAPCRIGNKRLHEILQKITSGNGAEEDLTRLRNLAMVIKDTALCGLGQTSPNPVLSTMDNFYDEYLAHVREHRCPSHQCRELTQYFINPEKCKGCTLCARVCPVHAITGGRKIPHIIDPQACIRCGTCMEKCKFGAIYVH